MEGYNLSDNPSGSRLNELEGYSDDAIFEGNRVEEMQDWLDTVYNVIKDSNAPRYEGTELREMNEEDKEIFKERSQESRGWSEIMAEFRLAWNKSGGYVPSEDSYTIPESIDVLQDLTDMGKGNIAHEAGHRLGYNIKDKRLKPLMDAHDFSGDTQHFNDDSFSDLLSFRFYLESEHFAERVKAAVANEFDENFEYDEVKIKQREEEDGSIVHEVYEDFIDYDRDEDLDELMENISREIRKIIDF